MHLGLGHLRQFDHTKVRLHFALNLEIAATFELGIFLFLRPSFPDLPYISEYNKITLDFPLAAAKAFASLSPQFNFVYISGEGVC